MIISPIKKEYSIFHTAKTTRKMKSGFIFLKKLGQKYADPTRKRSKEMLMKVFTHLLVLLLSI